MNPMQMVERTTDGDVTTKDSFLHCVTLTGGSDAATVVVKQGGSSGTTILTLKCAASTSVSTGYMGDVDCADGIYVDLTGTGPTVSVVHA